MRSSCLARLKEKVGLQLDMETVFVVGPLLVIRAIATAIELEALCATVGEKNAKAAQLGGCLLMVARMLGAEEVISNALKDVMLKQVLTKWRLRSRRR